MGFPLQANNVSVCKGLVASLLPTPNTVSGMRGTRPGLAITVYKWVLVQKKKG